MVPSGASERKHGTLILTFDFEDWHQLVHRRLGLETWDRRRDAFVRQMGEVLELLDELRVRATFFVLGVCARRYPELVEETAARGHEIACHGFAHERVSEQSRTTFRHDLLAAVALLENLVGERPRGYRAPAFSLTRPARWAYELLADEGFRYDSSQYDSARIRQRIGGIPRGPYRLVLGSGRELLELPVATSRLLGKTMPVGGGSYWRVLPSPVLRSALRRAFTNGVLYLHPYELDPHPLRAALPPRPPLNARAQALWAAAYWNLGRGSVSAKLRQAATDFRLVSCEEFICESGAGQAAGPLTLSEDGVLV